MVADLHELVGNQICDLDSVMEFGLKQVADRFTSR